MDYTGERMVPHQSGATSFWEHIYRYRFAAAEARGRDVVDVACGEGYGAAALLAAGARRVVGVDVDPATCRHAARRYQLATIAGDALQLPLADHCCELFVSFETIEHVAEPERLLAEAARVLTPEGVLVISTPNKGVYPVDNPFHLRELTADEFRALLSHYFTSVELYFQRPTCAARSWDCTPGWQSPLVQRLVALRGGWRLSAMLRRWTYGTAWCSEVDADLPTAVEAVLGRLPRCAQQFDPFLVRQLTANWKSRRPLYLIARARRPRRLVAMRQSPNTVRA